MTTKREAELAALKRFEAAGRITKLAPVKEGVVEDLDTGKLTFTMADKLQRAGLTPTGRFPRSPSDVLQRFSWPDTISRRG